MSPVYFVYSTVNPCESKLEYGTKLVHNCIWNLPDGLSYLNLGHSHVSEAALASVLMKVHFVLAVLKFASVGKRDYSGQQRLVWLALFNSI